MWLLARERPSGEPRAGAPAGATWPGRRRGARRQLAVIVGQAALGAALLGVGYCGSRILT